MTKENVIYEESFNTDLCNGCKEYVKLQEENEELKKELDKWKEEHHEQVLLANEEGWNRTQLQIENTKLKARIEKMKCCENCKYCDTDCEGHFVCTANVFYDCKSNKFFDNKDSKIDEWELAK